MERVLIIRTSSLGDIVHGLPVAAALKKAYPWIHLAWMVEDRYRDLLAASPCVDERIVVHFRHWPRTLLDPRKRRTLLRLARLSTRRSFDVAIDLQGLIRSGLLSWGSLAPVRIGFPSAEVREWPNALFSNLRPKGIPARSHVIDRNLALLHPLGVRTRERVFPLEIPLEWEQEVLPFFGPLITSYRRSLRVVIHPAAGWQTKEWSSRRYAEVGDRILGSWEAQVFLLWGPGEKQLAETVRGCMRRDARIVPDLDIRGLMALLKNCDLYIGGDSGPLHLASGLGTPVVAVYGPSDPVRNGPPGIRARVVRGSCACAPCWKRHCKDVRCMRSVTVEDLWAQVEGAVQEIRFEGNGPFAGPAGG
jgi:lipopolysaccharide heptosyltransferase I